MKSDHSLQTNVLVDAAGSPKSTDFGLAKVIDSQASTVSASSFSGKGSLRWQAPELLMTSQFDGDGGLTTKSDVYAYACVCLEVRLGRYTILHLLYC